MRSAEERFQKVRKAALMTGIDAQLDAHADTQLRFSRRIGDADPHRDPLHDLDPVAAGILRRQQGEFLRRRRAHALDDTVPFEIRIGVDFDRRLLSRTDIGQLGFFRAGLNPDVLGRYDVEGSGRRGEVLPGLLTRREKEIELFQTPVATEAPVVA